MSSAFPHFWSRFVAFSVISSTFTALAGCPKKTVTQPSGLYWPAGTPAELSADCKLDKEGKRPVEKCRFLVKPQTVKFQR